MGPDEETREEWGGGLPAVGQGGGVVVYQHGMPHSHHGVHAAEASECAAHHAVHVHHHLLLLLHHRCKRIVPAPAECVAERVAVACVRLPPLTHIADKGAGTRKGFRATGEGGWRWIFVGGEV